MSYQHAQQPSPTVLVVDDDTLTRMLDVSDRCSNLI